MKTARVSVHPSFIVAPVSRRTFGTFVEHLGRSVYTGIYEPDHPAADEDGLRTDVLELVRELGISTVRYPGGNFVSAYRWEDGVGPVEDRPTRLDLAWHSADPNTFGLHEFMLWCKKAEAVPMLAVNLGTRGIESALDILEYSNVKSGTRLSDLRRANGADEPFGVRMWCLGNEMDGPWQVGHKTPQEYGRIAAETASAMRMIDPDLELVACGSSSTAMPTFGEWERVVLDAAFDQVDLISAHTYYWMEDDDIDSFLASAVDMDDFIAGVSATADAVAAAKKSKKRINISFDEWNVWYQQRVESKTPEGDNWPVAPRLLEDRYSVADAVVVGNLLISLLRHSDRVSSASQAQLVNVIGPIMTEPGGPAWRQTIFHPFALMSRHANGVVLQCQIECDSHVTRKYGEVPLVDSVVTYDEEHAELAVFAVNRSTSELAPLEVDLRSFGNVQLVEAVTYTNDDVSWQATMEDATSVLPEAMDASVGGGQLRADLPPVSWNMLRLAIC